MTSHLSEQDRKLINHLQDDLPLVSRPFAVVGQKMGLSEQDVINRIRHLRDDGILTRFGPFFDAQALGGSLCLCAMIIPEDQFEDIAAKVNAYPEVAHNYQRDHRLNMWFVLATETQLAMTNTIKSIEQETGLRVFSFPKEREFFIGFRVAI